jgi:hypothetical protein
MKEIPMTRGYIRYRGDYKYQLASEYRIKVTILPAVAIATDFLDLDVDGELKVKNGYAWDGPSGPVIDTKENLRASLVHDALYQLMRLEKLNSRTYRKTADKIFRNICKQDGVPSITANIYYKALRKFGKPATSPEGKKRIRRAPRQ